MSFVRVGTSPTLQVAMICFCILMSFRTSRCCLSGVFCCCEPDWELLRVRPCELCLAFCVQGTWSWTGWRATNASRTTAHADVAVGGVLSQVINGVERPIAFFSKVLGSTQKKYCTTRRELLAVILALQHFRHYLLGNKIILRTDHHSIKWLKTFKRPKASLPVR